MKRFLDTYIGCWREILLFTPEEAGRLAFGITVLAIALLIIYVVLA